MRVADLQGFRRVGQDVLQEALRVFAGDLEAPHVGDVEQAGMAPGGEVFADRPGLVLDRHIPAPEFDHARALGAVPIMENGFFEPACILFRHHDLT